MSAPDFEALLQVAADALEAVSNMAHLAKLQRGVDHRDVLLKVGERVDAALPKIVEALGG